MVTLTVSRSGISTNALSLTATGFAGSQDRSVNRNGNGLGVKLRNSGDNVQVDGLGPDETLRLDIDGTASYRLWEVGYGAVWGNDDYKLIVGGANAAYGDFGGTGSVAIDYLMDNIFGNIFDFTVLRFNDDYRVEWFTIKSAAVPAALP